MQYTIGWRFETNKFLDALDKDNSIEKTFLFGAYSEDKESQVKRVEELNKKFGGKSNFLIEFKKLRLKGGKHKGNMDTEITYQAIEYKNSFDTMILFSGDGDFAYMIRQFISSNKNIFIFSTSSHVGVELYEIKQEINDDEVFGIYDINSDSDSTTAFLKTIVRGPLFLLPELNSYYKSLNKDEIQKNVETT